MADPITLIKTVAFQSSLLDEASARDEKQLALDNAEDAIEETYQHRTKKAEEEAEAIRDEFNGRKWGYIFGGWLGMLIGWAIGSANSNKHDHRASAAEESAGLSSLVREEAVDDMSDADDNIDDAQQRNDMLDAFMDEVRTQERQAAEEGLA